MVTPYVVLAARALEDAVGGATVPLDGGAHHHLVRVLKRREGDRVVATDGSGREVDATLVGHGLAVTGVRDLPAPAPRIQVVQALGKGRKHDEVVRMLTELGVDVVTAVTTTRTQVDLAGKAARVRGRWRAVAEAACSQSRRPRRPLVEGPVALVDWLDGLDPTSNLLLVADVDADTGPLTALADASARADRVTDVALLIGPEGGFTAAELDAATAVGGRTVSLGPTVLRTEHAGVVLAAVAAAALGRMG